jgi:multidrug efflux pump subunit AcrA (membrane-fusion protein)
MKYLKNKFVWIGIIIIIFILIMINSFLKNNQNEIYTIETNDLNQIITISGKIVPAQEVDLSFEISGQIQQIYVDIGDEV